jgi:hypothetical protein
VWKRCQLNCWVAGFGDATQLELVVANITFKNQDFPSEGSFGTFDDLGPVSRGHYDSA